jgi:uncharacterized membrane-anchored protein YhcB (DUF1043 family)
MIVVTRNWKVSLVALAVSVGIFLVVFFTVIQPSTHTADAAIKQGMQQSQQALNQAQQQLKQSGAQASSAAGGASGATKQIKAATQQAGQDLSKAQKLTKCVAAAGTDASKLANCQAQFN